MLQNCLGLTYVREAPYLFRCLSTFLADAADAPRRVREFLAEEEEAITEGRIYAVGRRYVACPPTPAQRRLGPRRRAGRESRLDAEVESGD
jgi:hypothetical protein